MYNIIVTFELFELVEHFLRFGIVLVTFTEILFDSLFELSFDIIGGWVETNLSDLNSVDLVSDVLDAFLLGSNIGLQILSQLGDNFLDLGIDSGNFNWVSSSGSFGIKGFDLSFGIVGLLLKISHGLTLINSLMGDRRVDDLT